MSDSLNYQEFSEKLLAQEVSKEMMYIKQLMLIRMAMEGDIKNSRIPAPLNITEIGGYYNLLEKQNEQIMLRQLVSSALGLPNDYAPQVTDSVIRELLLKIMERTNEA